MPPPQAHAPRPLDSALLQRRLARYDAKRTWAEKKLPEELKELAQLRALAQVKTHINKGVVMTAGGLPFAAMVDAVLRNATASFLFPSAPRLFNKLRSDVSHAGIFHSFLASLPVELLIRIFHYLPPSDLMIMIRTCKYFFDILDRLGFVVKKLVNDFSKPPILIQSEKVSSSDNWHGRFVERYFSDLRSRTYSTSNEIVASCISDDKLIVASLYEKGEVKIEYANNHDLIKSFFPKYYNGEIFKNIWIFKNYFFGMTSKAILVYNLKEMMGDARPEPLNTYVFPSFVSNEMAISNNGRYVALIVRDLEKILEINNFVLVYTINENRLSVVQKIDCDFYCEDVKFSNDDHELIIIGISEEVLVKFDTKSIPVACLIPVRKAPAPRPVAGLAIA